jgi:hypothetical protein
MAHAEVSTQKMVHAEVSTQKIKFWHLLSR